MNTLLIVGIYVMAAVAVALIVTFRRAVRSTVVTPPDPEWAAGFNPSRYQPMQRLLNESEFEYLSSQPGFERAMLRRLRAERRRIFRQYVKLVRRDFDRFYALAKTMIVHSAEDRSEFQSALFRQRVAFAFAIMSIELRLALQVTGARLDIASVTNPVEALRLQVRQLSPAAA